MSDRKIALVTGGSRGIGRAITLELAQNGYHVIINFKSNEEAAKNTLQEVTALGTTAELAPFDVTDYQACQDAIKVLLKKHECIDVLVNNAGVTKDTLFAMMPEKSWRLPISVTLDGFYNVTRPVIKRMIAKRKGSIVSLSSITAITGNPGQANYSTAKAGLVAATKSVAQEVARFGIRINAVAPGLIETDMIKDTPIEKILPKIPMERLGTPEEVAKVVRFLCSDDASYVTGQVISINGGMI